MRYHANGWRDTLCTPAAAYSHLPDPLKVSRGTRLVNSTNNTFDMPYMYAQVSGAQGRRMRSGSRRPGRLSWKPNTPGSSAPETARVLVGRVSTCQHLWPQRLRCTHLMFFLSSDPNHPARQKHTVLALAARRCRYFEDNSLLRHQSQPLPIWFHYACH